MRYLSTTVSLISVGAPRKFGAATCAITYRSTVQRRDDQKCYKDGDSELDNNDWTRTQTDRLSVCHSKTVICQNEKRLMNVLRWANRSAKCRVNDVDTNSSHHSVIAPLWCSHSASEQLVAGQSLPATATWAVNWKCRTWNCRQEPFDLGFKCAEYDEYITELKRLFVVRVRRQSKGSLVYKFSGTCHRELLIFWWGLLVCFLCVFIHGSISLI